MRLPVLAVTLASVAALTACKSSSDDATVTVETESSSVSTPAVLADHVEILAHVAGDQLRIEDHTLVILDQEAFDQLQLGEVFTAAGTDIDFAEHSVILLSLGQQATGGYSAEITGLQQKGETVYVQATAVAPAEGSTNTQALTYPYAAVAVKKLPAGTVLRSDITSIP